MDPILAFSKSAATGLSITAVCKNAGKKTLGQDDFFVVTVSIFDIKSLAVGDKWLGNVDISAYIAKLCRAAKMRLHHHNNNMVQCHNTPKKESENKK